MLGSLANENNCYESKGELFLGLVTSKMAHARLLDVDVSAARSMPGVVEIIDSRDVPHLNEWETLEVVFATDKVRLHHTTSGWVIGLDTEREREGQREKEREGAERERGT